MDTPIDDSPRCLLFGDFRLIQVVQVPHFKYFDAAVSSSPAERPAHNVAHLPLIPRLFALAYYVHTKRLLGDFA